MLYLFSLLDVTGKRPVWSEQICPVITTTLAYTKWVQTVGSGVEGGVVMTVGASMVEMAGRGLDVDRRFLGEALRCPLAVARDLGRYFLTATPSAVSPGQLVKKFFLIA
jgi:hypothetical protein